MPITKEDKLNAIAAARGPLEHELFSAELDLLTARESRSEELVAEPEARRDEVKAKLKALDDVESKIS